MNHYRFKTLPPAVFSTKLRARVGMRRLLWNINGLHVLKTAHQNKCSCFKWIFHWAVVKCSTTHCFCGRGQYGVMKRRVRPSAERGVEVGRENAVIALNIHEHGQVWQVASTWLAPVSGWDVLVRRRTFCPRVIRAQKHVGFEWYLTTCRVSAPPQRQLSLCGRRYLSTKGGECCGCFGFRTISKPYVAMWKSEAAWF